MLRRPDWRMRRPARSPVPAVIRPRPRRTPPCRDSSAAIPRTSSRPCRRSRRDGFPRPSWNELPRAFPKTRSKPSRPGTARKRIEEWRRLMTRTNRREFLKAAAAGAALLPLPAIAQGAGARVVVVGGGFGGATCARFIKRIDPRINVTLVEANRTFIACPFSNTVIAGLRDLAAQQFGYDKLAADQVAVEFSPATGIDPQRRTVTLGNGGWRHRGDLSTRQSVSLPARPLRASKPDRLLPQNQEAEIETDHSRRQGRLLQAAPVRERMEGALFQPRVGLVIEGWQGHFGRRGCDDAGHGFRPAQGRCRKCHSAAEGGPYRRCSRGCRSHRLVPDRPRHLRIQVAAQHPRNRRRRDRRRDAKIGLLGQCSG